MSSGCWKAWRSCRRGCSWSWNCNIRRSPRNLLEIVYPHYLAPTPSMMVAALHARHRQRRGQGRAIVLKRHTQLRARPVEGEQTACIFRTAADVTLWPLEIAEVEYIDSRGGLVAAGVSRADRGAGRHPAAAEAQRRRQDRRAAAGPADAVPERPGRQCRRAARTAVRPRRTGIVGRSTDRRADWTLELPKAEIAAEGLRRRKRRCCRRRRESFDGYRLLQEYFAMPERFHFVELTGPAAGAEAGARRRMSTSTSCCATATRDLGAGLTTRGVHAALRCRRSTCSRGASTGSMSPTRDVEQHVVPNRTAPLDYEVYALDSVVGIARRGQGRHRVPAVLFGQRHHRGRRTPPGLLHHPPPDAAAQREASGCAGVRTSYLGSEIYISLVDARAGAYRPPTSPSWRSTGAVHQPRPADAAVHRPAATCSTCPTAARWLSVATPVAPTRPRPTMAQGDTAWRLISHLSPELPLDRRQPRPAAPRRCANWSASTRPSGDRVLAKQLEGIARRLVATDRAPHGRRGAVDGGARARDHARLRRKLFRRLQRLPARRGARAVLPQIRHDQFLYRNRSDNPATRRDCPMDDRRRGWAG